MWRWLLLLSACGRIDFDPVSPAMPPDNGGFTDGTRLHNEWWQFDDGTRSWRTAYDTVLDERCQIANWSDGNLYCVPSGVEVDFLDANCTMPVVRVDSTSPRPPTPYAALETMGTCGLEHSQLYQGGAQVQATSYYFLPIGGPCSGPSGFGAGDTVYAATTAPVTTLASVTLETAPLTGRYARQSYVASDGFRMRAGLFDSSVSSTCLPSGVGGRDICFPNALNATYFSDAQCMNHLGISFLASSCSVPQFALYSSNQSCETDVAPIDTAIANPSTVYFEQVLPGMVNCLSTTESATQVFTLHPGTALPHSTRSVSAQPGARLQVVDDVFDGASYRIKSVYDPAIDADCSVGQTIDGLMRCVPNLDADIDNLVYYSDAACTQVTNVIPISLPTCDPPTPMFVGLYGQGPGFTYFPITPSSYAGPLYGMSGGCSQVTAGVRYDIGAALPSSTFEAATSVVDP